MPALELTKAERTQLKTIAHHLKPLVQLGNKGLTDAVIKEIDTHIKAHQLIKVKIASDSREERQEIQDTICDSLSCALVQLVGKTLVLYRPAEDESAGIKDEFVPKKKAAQASEEARRRTKSPARPAAARPNSVGATSHNIPRKGSALSLRSRRNAARRKLRD